MNIDMHHIISCRVQERPWKLVVDHNHLDTHCLQLVNVFLYSFATVLFILVPIANYITFFVTPKGLMLL